MVTQEEFDELLIEDKLEKVRKEWDIDESIEDLLREAEEEIRWLKKLGEWAGPG